MSCWGGSKTCLNNVQCNNITALSEAVDEKLVDSFNNPLTKPKAPVVAAAVVVTTSAAAAAAAAVAPPPATALVAATAVDALTLAVVEKMTEEVLEQATSEEDSEEGYKLRGNHYRIR
jgi:hypothetical protein